MECSKLKETPNPYNAWSLLFVLQKMFDIHPKPWKNEGILGPTNMGEVSTKNDSETVGFPWMLSSW